MYNLLVNAIAILTLTYRGVIVVYNIQRLWKQRHATRPSARYTRTTRFKN